MSALDDYLRKVRALVHTSRDFLTDTHLADVEHLVDHNEHSEALLLLAEIIVQDNKHVSAEIVMGIRELSAGMIDESELPPELDSYILD